MSLRLTTGVLRIHLFLTLKNHLRINKRETLVKDQTNYVAWFSGLDELICMIYNGSGPLICF